MAITRGNVTASSYGESFDEPAATAGDLLVANVTWFSGAATPTISGWTIVPGSNTHNGSGSSPVGCALFTKVKGSGSSGPHSVGGGVSDYLVVCQAWSGVRASDPIAPVTGNGNQSDPYQIPLDSLTVGEDGSVEVLYSSSWTFPIDLPAGFTEWLQHSFEVLYCRRSVDAGPAGGLTAGRGFAADSGTTLRYIVRPVDEGGGDDYADGSGVASAALTASGALSGDGDLAGSATPSAQASATIEGLADISGSADATLVASGQLAGSGDLSGSATAALSASGSLEGTGALAGAAAA